MTPLSRRAGTACLRWLFLASCLLGLAAGAVLAQGKDVTLKADDRNKLEQFRNGNNPVVVGGSQEATAANRQVLDRVAKYFATKVADPNAHRDFGPVMQEYTRRLAGNYTRLKDPQRQNVEQFVNEYGKALIANLERPATGAGRPVVKVNAARMAAEVGKMGYDGAAELYVKILEKPDESDAVKLWALHGLHNLFAIVPDPVVAPARTVFQKKNDAVLTPLELKAIKALIAFLDRKVELPEGTTPQEEDALRFVRREAIRALGHVRVYTAKNLGQVDSRPGLALLKVARKDIPAPVPSYAEMMEGAIGFCQLLPQTDREREVHLDYAVYHVAQALVEILSYRVEHPNDITMPWKATGGRLREALENWAKYAEEYKLQNANLVKELSDLCGRDIFPALEGTQPGAVLNVPSLVQWARAHPPKSESLYKSDPKAKVNAQ
jgi:hypothetical protein